MNAHRQRGTTTVEFAIVGMVTLLLLFTVIEFGRILFTLNMLDEGARRGARVAAVCDVGDAAIAQATAFVSLPGPHDFERRHRVPRRYGAPLGDPAGADYAVDLVRPGPDRELQLPGRNPADCHDVRGAGDFGHVAAGKSGRAEFRRGPGLLTETANAMAHKLKVLLASRSAEALKRLESEPRQRARRRFQLAPHQQWAYRPAARCPHDARTCWCCASTPTASQSSPRSPSRTRATARRSLSWGPPAVRKPCASRSAAARATSSPSRSMPKSSWPRSSACGTSRAASETHRQPADVMVVLGAAGGVGTSFVACNLAQAFAGQTGASTLLMDLDVNSAPLASFLDLNPERGLPAALAEVEFLDQHALAGYVTPPPQRLAPARRAEQVHAFRPRPRRKPVCVADGE